jgi:hypothetical protein
LCIVPSGGQTTPLGHGGAALAEVTIEPDARNAPKAIANSMGDFFIFLSPWFKDLPNETTEWAHIGSIPLRKFFNHLWELGSPGLVWL